ncbi:hypothetical protein RLIN73S_00147 [Rhodanobacter lindaniclasticus]
MTMTWSHSSPLALWMLLSVRCGGDGHEYDLRRAISENPSSTSENAPQPNRIPQFDPMIYLDIGESVPPSLDQIPDHPNRIRHALGRRVFQ